MKKIELGHSAMGFALSILLRVVCFTLRWDKRGLNINGKHWSLSEPVILVFWHGDQLMMPWAYRSSALKKGAKELHALVSMHSDGRIAAKALGHLSINTVDGSSSRGAAKALLQMRKRVSKGCHIAITPDGPKGPIHIAKNGAVLLSSTAKIPLFPVTIVAEKYWQLKSWDNMYIPKPFSRTVILAAEPYTVSEGLTREELQEECGKLESCLNNLKIKASEILCTK